MESDEMENKFNRPAQAIGRRAFRRSAVKRLNTLNAKRLDDGLVHRDLEKEMERKENIHGMWDASVPIK